MIFSGRKGPLNRQAKVANLCRVFSIGFLANIVANALIKATGYAWLGCPVSTCSVDALGGHKTKAPAPVGQGIGVRKGSYPAMALAPARTGTGVRPFRGQDGKKHRDVSRSAADLSTLSYLFQTYPYTMDFITCFIKGTCADQVAQRSFSEGDASESKVSWRRTAAYALYAGAYQGCCQHFLFNIIFPMLYGNGVDMMTVAMKVATEVFIITPTLCLPCAYVVKALVFNKSIKEGYQAYWKDVCTKGLLFRYWAVWIPTECVVFSVIPEEFRIAFIAMVSFFWLIGLSIIASGKKGAGADLKKARKMEMQA